MKNYEENRIIKSALERHDFFVFLNIVDLPYWSYTLWDFSVALIKDKKNLDAKIKLPTNKLPNTSIEPTKNSVFILNTKIQLNLIILFTNRKIMNQTKYFFLFLHFWKKKL